MNLKNKNDGRFVGLLHLLDQNEVVKKYNELKTLKDVAKYFNISAEGLRKYFIKNEIEYKKKIVYVCDDKFFSRDNELSFYWAGFMAADGNVSKQNDVGIILKSSDINHLIKFQEIIKTNSPITYNTNKERTININGKIHTIKTSTNIRIRIRSYQMAKDLQRFNIIPNKTKTYDIPEWIINHQLFHHFIRGYFDGDGWFSLAKTKNKLKISWGICGNLPVVEKIQQAIINNCYITGKPFLCKQINIFKLTYQKQHDVVNIIEYLYKDATVFLDRKYELTKVAKQLDNDTVILNLDRNKLQESFQRLKSYKLVAKELNCCKSSIFNYIKKYDIKLV